MCKDVEDFGISHNWCWIIYTTDFHHNITCDEHSFNSYSFSTNSITDSHSYSSSNVCNSDYDYDSNASNFLLWSRVDSSTPEFDVFDCVYDHNDVVSSNYERNVVHYGLRFIYLLRNLFLKMNVKM